MDFDDFAAGLVGATPVDTRNIKLEEIRGIYTRVGGENLSSQDYFRIRDVFIAAVKIGYFAGVEVKTREAYEEGKRQGESRALLALRIARPATS
jgi:hypothetical protein